MCVCACVRVGECVYTKNTKSMPKVSYTFTQHTHTHTHTHSHVEEGPECRVAEEGPECRVAEEGPECRVAEEGPECRVAEEGPECRVAEEGPECRVAEKGPECRVAEEGPECRVAEEGPECRAAEELGGGRGGTTVPGGGGAGRGRRGPFSYLTNCKKSCADIIMSKCIVKLETVNLPASLIAILDSLASTHEERGSGQTVNTRVYLPLHQGFCRPTD